MLKKLFKRKEAVTSTTVVDAGGNGNKPVIQLRNLVKTYTSVAGDFPVLKGIDANIYHGEFVAVIGRSGSGKSTLVNMITGIDHPTAGDVIVNDQAVHALNESDMAEWRGRNLGIVFQFFQLLPMLSLIENIMLPMDFCDMYTPRGRKERALELLRMVELEEHANKLPSTISGGQQQRVAIARALANDPSIILADEPTGNLDSKTAEVVFGIFEELVKQGKTILMVTHDSSLARKVTRTMLLVDGEIINEYVSKALPLLTARQMVKVTQQLLPMHFEAGATILHEGEPGNKFYIITGGKAEVVLKGAGGTEVVVSQMGQGQYFGEIEIMRGSHNAATIRASEYSPVDVVAMEREAMIELMKESKATREAIE